MGVALDWTGTGAQVLAAGTATFAALAALRIARKDRRVSAERADLQRQYDLLLRLTIAAEPVTVSAHTPPAPDRSHEAQALLLALGHERLPLTWAFYFSEWPDGTSANPGADWQASRRERFELLQELTAQIRDTY